MLTATSALEPSATAGCPTGIPLARVLASLNPYAYNCRNAFNLQQMIPVLLNRMNYQDLNTMLYILQLRIATRL